MPNWIQNSLFLFQYFIIGFLSSEIVDLTKSGKRSKCLRVDTHCYVLTFKLLFTRKEQEQRDYTNVDELSRFLLFYART